MHICTICQSESIPKILTKLSVACRGRNGLVVLLLHAELQCMMVICNYEEMLFV